MEEDESTSDDDFVLSSPVKNTRSSSTKVSNSAKNSTKKVKVKEEEDEINEEDESQEYQCYYCGKMIVSLKNVKEHMREKHRRFHR